MKILRKKLKKVHIVKKILFLLTLLIYIPSLVYFTMGLLKLTGIETILRIAVIVFFIIWLFVYLLGGFISMIVKKNKTFIVLTIFTLLFCPVFDISSYYIHKVIGSLSAMNKNTITYTTKLIALKETNFDKTGKIGMIKTEEDIEGNQLAKKLIQKENLTNKVNVYDDYQEMIRDLYDGKIKACFVTGNYAITFEDENFEEVKEGETEVPLADRVKVLYEYSEERENSDMVILQESKTKQLTEPFSILVMGVDSESDGLKANQAFNGDTLILVTFNPNTLTTTMFSLPRDLYVPIACNHNRYAKINSAAAYGSTCVINTVKQLTGIKIDYYLKMNFKGVVQLVDAIGGVTVDVEEPDFNMNSGVNCKGQVCEQNSDRAFGKNTVFIKPGIQTLNGEQALAYARNRHQYAMSDIARNQHQQDLIAAVAQKVKGIRSISEFEEILNTVSKNIETNMTPEQILSFYNVGKDMLSNSNTESLSIKKTYLSYYNLTVWRGYNASALGYYQSSLDAITKLMRVNLGLESEKPIKTFKISYNEDYTTPLVGMGLNGGEKLETLPNFFGYDKDYVSDWCSTRNLTCNFEEVKSTEEEGFIITQSAYANELLKSLSSVTFTYSDGSGYKVETEEDDDEDDEKDDDKESDKDENKDEDKESNKDENKNEDKESNNDEEENKKPVEEEKPKEEEKPSEENKEPTEDKKDESTSNETNTETTE